MSHWPQGTSNDQWDGGKKPLGNTLHWPHGAVSRTPRSFRWPCWQLTQHREAKSSSAKRGIDGSRRQSLFPIQHQGLGWGSSPESRDMGVWVGLADAPITAKRAQGNDSTVLWMLIMKKKKKKNTLKMKKELPCCSKAPPFPSSLHTWFYLQAIGWGGGRFLSGGRLGKRGEKRHRRRWGGKKSGARSPDQGQGSTKHGFFGEPLLCRALISQAEGRMCECDASKQRWEGWSDGVNLQKERGWGN